MAGSVNRVILIGNLGKDPEVRSFQNGGRVCNFSIATSEVWKDKTSGQRVEKTEWHRVSITNDKLVEVAEKYLRKGSKVYIEGQLETRKWTDKEGREQYTTEVVVKPFRGELQMLDGKKDGDGVESHDAAAPSSAGYSRPAPTGRGDPQRNYPKGQRPADDRSPATAADLAELNDEIPF